MRSTPSTPLHPGIADEEITQFQGHGELHGGRGIGGVEDGVTVGAQGVDDEGDHFRVLVGHDDAQPVEGCRIEAVPLVNLRTQDAERQRKRGGGGCDY